MATQVFTRPRPVKQTGPVDTRLPHPPAPLRGRVGGGTTGEKAGEKNSEASKYEEVLAQALQLNSVERRSLMAELSLADQRGGADEWARDKEMWAIAVHEALQTALGASDGAVQGPALIRRVMAASAAWAPVLDVIQAMGRDKMEVVERQAVYRFLAVLLVDRSREVARYAKTPLSLKLVANNAGNLRGIFDRSFPGYLAAGLGRLIARQIAAGRLPGNGSPE